MQKIWSSEFVTHRKGLSLMPISMKTKKKKNSGLSLLFLASRRVMLSIFPRSLECFPFPQLLHFSKCTKASFERFMHEISLCPCFTSFFSFFAASFCLCAYWGQKELLEVRGGPNLNWKVNQINLKNWFFFGFRSASRDLIFCILDLGCVFLVLCNLKISIP